MILRLVKAPLAKYAMFFVAVQGPFSKERLSYSYGLAQ